ncbi:hypothetical protein CTI12_AA555540 [Artemisia annua]|uniref:Uncharacterized protein n=1 Tax=Artemisia annua TaxID=35608 RepID=A0A2U1KWV6_ARTAN|nr:hypothetical protein CTI12_AA555540 [Artemisia annua]
MKIQLSFLLLLMILLVTSVHMSSSRNIVENSSREERIQANFVSTFKRHFHVNPKLVKEENPLIHVVSRRI